MDWRDSAKCRTLSGEQADRLFFNEIKSRAYLAAKEFCTDCPVQTECLIYAIENDMYGVWAGTTYRDRKRMRRLHRLSTEPPKVVSRTNIQFH